MNALELCERLEKSGTGAEKMDVARAVARDMKTTLKALDARELVDEMKRRFERWVIRREAQQNTGGERRRVEARSSQAHQPHWADVTIQKADRILAGMPAVPEAAGKMSAVYDVDDPVPGTDLDETLKAMNDAAASDAPARPAPPAEDRPPPAAPPQKIQGPPASPARRGRPPGQKTLPPGITQAKPPEMKPPQHEHDKGDTPPE